MKKKKKREVGLKKRPLGWNVATFILGMAVSLCLFLAVIFLVYTFTVKSYNYGQTLADSMMAPAEDKPVAFVVSEGDTASDVAANLEKEGVIKNALLFRLENLLKGVSRDYKPGTYQLNMDMDTSQINAVFNGTGQAAPTIKITIVEGSSVNDIAQYLEKNNVCKATDFIDACNNDDFSEYAFLSDVPKRDNRMEGYLFPDTYFLSANPDPDEIIGKMLARFDEIYTDAYAAQAKAMGLTMDQVITVASMIEKEIKIPVERPLDAEVIYNRLDADMPLQIDATVLYALGVKKDKLTYDDLQVVSPYNTYLNKGLPPGPICNPGEACIQAALNPAQGGYLYYVVKDSVTGEHFWTDNYDDFQAAKALYAQGQ
ncbi:MAG: endolytic transglycosylase MltG [Defluviitaleaceae bacterium]|nr:endolytic transglycosylase MltG [Defluviitaleaceae bacterium]